MRTPGVLLLVGLALVLGPSAARAVPITFMAEGVADVVGANEAYRVTWTIDDSTPDSDGSGGSGRFEGVAVEIVVDGRRFAGTSEALVAADRYELFGLEGAGSGSLFVRPVILEWSSTQFPDPNQHPSALALGPTSAFAFAGDGLGLSGTLTSLIRVPEPGGLLAVALVLVAGSLARPGA